jgi:hypothetical protein
MAKIKVAAGTDPLTGKKIKVEQTAFVWNNNGQPQHINFLVQFYEVDGTTPTPPTGNYISKRAVTEYEDKFEFQGWMNPTTKVVVSSDTPGAVNIKSYFETKVINTLQGVGGSDTLFKLQEGVLKEVVLILQANGILP